MVGEKKSIPVSISIVVGSLELKDVFIVGGESSARSGASFSIFEVTINIKVLTGSSMSNIDKFKLSGVVTCCCKSFLRFRNKPSRQDRIL